MGTKYIIEVEDKPFELLSEDGFTSEKLFRVKGFNSLVFDWNGLNMLTPYTEPDLEQVKADAYLKGLNDGQGVILESTQNNAFNNGYKKCLEDMEHDKGKENSIGYKIGYKKGYIDGLNRISDYEDKIRKEAYEKGWKEAEDHYEKGYDDGYDTGLSDAWEAARNVIALSTVDRREVFGSEYMYSILEKHTAAEAIEKIRQYEQEKEEIQVGDEIKSGNERYVVLQKYLNNIDELMAVLFNRRDGEISVFHLYNGNGAIFEKTGRNFHELVEILQKMKGGEQDG